MKKFLCMFLLCAMVFSLLPVVAVAETDSVTLGGEKLEIDSVVADGTKWKYEDIAVDSLWLGENDTIVQVTTSLCNEVDPKGLGLVAKLATPSTLTGFVITLDGTEGKAGWKSYMNSVKLYASVDGTDWTEVGAISGVTETQTELVLNIASTDIATVYRYVAFYQTEPSRGFRFCGIQAYGKPVAMPKLYGSQTSDIYQNDGVDCYSIRFVATVDTNALNRVGYRISILNNTQKIIRQYTTQSTTLYTAIHGGNQVYDAQTLGGTFIQTLVVSNIPVSLGALTFVVTPLSYHSTGTVVGESGSVSYTVSNSGVSLAQSSSLTNQIIRINDASLEGYQIVYDADNAEAGADYAALLIETIKNATGIELTAVPDTGTACAKEILLGETNRGTHENLNLLNCKIAVSEGKIQISAGGAFSLRYAAMNFAELLERDYAGTVNLSDGYSVTESLETDSARPLSTGASFRIMSANVLAKQYHELNGTMAAYRFPERIEIFMAMLEFYAPDVIGLQEADDYWTSYLEALVSSSNGKWGLLGVSDTASNGSDHASVENENWSLILYRKDKIDVVESGIREFSHYASTRTVTYRMTWAVLKETTTQKQFGLVNTHWMPKDEIYALTECEETAALIAELEEKYGCAMFSTADYNSNETTTQYKNLNALYPNAKYSATTLVNSIGSWHDYGKSTPSYYSCDHIFVNSCVDVLAFRTLMHNQQIYASDHAWIYADVAIGGIAVSTKICTDGDIVDFD